jgi:hypothetical protein
VYTNVPIRDLNFTNITNIGKRAILFLFFIKRSQIKPPDVQEKYMIGEKETTEHGVTLIDAPLLLDKGFGLEEVSLTTLLELAELKSNKN